MESNNKIIYHYCGSDIFHKIIASKQLWLTDSSKMNDSTECKYLLTLIQDYLKNPQNTIEEDKKIKLLKQAEEVFNLNIRSKFLSCFSVEKDLLSQWRGYANDGFGFSIGFNLKKLKKASNLIQVESVLYDTKSQKEKIRSILYSSGDLDGVLNKYNALFKHPAFKEEKEFRIIYSPDSLIDKDNDLKMEFQITNEGIFRYYLLEFNTEVVEEIVIGPQNKTDEISLKKFLVNIWDKSSNIKIVKSVAPYKV